MKLYQYDFDLADGWSPTADERAAVETAMRSVLPAAETTSITWDTDGIVAPPNVAVRLDLEERWALEGLTLVIQAFNAAYIYVDGYPRQTCVPRAIGGMHSPAVAIGSVDCVGFSAIAA